MQESITQSFVHNFLGHAPKWYKTTVVLFLILNPILYYTAGGNIAGWVLIAEFIFTLALALKCYPLQPGGLLALEAVFLGMTSPSTVIHEVEANLEVLLLLVFMVAGIYFLKDLLLFTFSRILLRVRSKVALGLMFSIMGAFLSAFLDALTVTAVVISVAVGFYGVYHRVASGKGFYDNHDHNTDDELEEQHREDLEKFRAFLRSLLMHAAVGTALGGVMTLVGEPQNLLIASKAHWNFAEFFLRMAPVTVPVLVVGLTTVVVLQKTGWFGYGGEMPEQVRQIMEDFMKHEDEKRTPRQKLNIVVQGLVAAWLIIGLAFHLAAVGLIGLSVIVLATAFTGVIEEHQIGKAFEEALPFTALLVVFFTIVGVIADQQLFAPIIHAAIQNGGDHQIALFYLANGLLSSVSDNVFVATVYIDEVKNALLRGEISRDLFDELAVAINTGTNIPSVATPNGQAAFLFLLTSAIAPLVRLSYGRMVIMALPYTLTMSLTGYAMVYYALDPVTKWMYEQGIIKHHSTKELDESADICKANMGH